MTTVTDFLAAVDRLAPFASAESWDNVGLLLGDAARPVRRALVCLGVSEAVCAEAERRRAEVVFSHHPMFFKDMNRLTSDTRHGRLALRLASAGRACIAAHTNLDGAPGGLCDLLAERLGLVDLEPLRPQAEGGRAYKVVVFVPESDLEAVRAAAFAAGAGHIDRYAECSFSVVGEGTFRPGAGSRPRVGSPGRATRVRERRLELRAGESQLGGVLGAVARAHSYETPAIDVYPLLATPGPGGIGRVGRLKKSLTPAALADELKRVLGGAAVAVAGGGRRRIERVAVGTGGGGGLADAVVASGAQAYVTGEMKLHYVEDLASRGVAVVLGGHWETERVPLEVWARRLARETDVEVLMSRRESAPLQWA